MKNPFNDMSDVTECPNCGTTIKSGTFSSTVLLGPKATAIINEYVDDEKSDYCNKCSTKLLIDAKRELDIEFDEVSKKFNDCMNKIPVITLQAPQQWEYDILGIVTAQSVTGTGVLTEITSSFTDFFGMQSGRYNAKIKGGENLCLSQLRKYTLDIGGNTIIGTDIDYAEVGGGKGMLMVCMTGTAIKLNNTKILGVISKDIENAAPLNERLMHLSMLKSYAGY